jgi:hypothetical protein
MQYQRAALLTRIVELRFGVAISFDCRTINNEDQRLIWPFPLDNINKLLECPAIERLVIIRRDFRQPMAIGVGDFDFSRFDHAAIIPWTFAWLHEKSHRREGSSSSARAMSGAMPPPAKSVDVSTVVAAWIWTGAIAMT